jgi:hypothetical protein
MIVHLSNLPELLQEASESLTIKWSLRFMASILQQAQKHEDALPLVVLTRRLGE